MIAATYVSHSVRRGLINGRVLVAPDDDPQGQGAMAIEVALGSGAGTVVKEIVGPQIRIVTREGAESEIRLSPADYFPSMD